ncbi:hypothetical protein OPQ81_009120 [Rhizoctonia solani]|nr:hypothetical protein OPQ81_009120 [Rhizoctonia solani]
MLVHLSSDPQTPATYRPTKLNERHPDDKPGGTHQIRITICATGLWAMASVRPKPGILATQGCTGTTSLFGLRTYPPVLLLQKSGNKTMGEPV